MHFQDGGNSASLTLSKVAGIFYILCGGMTLSMIAAFTEYLYRAKKQKHELAQVFSYIIKYYSLLNSIAQFK